MTCSSFQPAASRASITAERSSWTTCSGAPSSNGAPPSGTLAENTRHPLARRAVGEQVMATLKSWRLLRKLRCSTTRITDLVKAVLALHLATPS